MKLNQLKTAQGHRTERKRVGRGIGSGKGNTSGRGHKGQMSRSGSARRPGFEGGQMPLVRRVPKRGFNNKAFSTTYQIVNIRALNKFEANSEITPEILKKSGLVDSIDNIKILSVGKLDKALTVKVHVFSKNAAAKIQEAGGKIEILK